MLANPMNIPPVSNAAAKAALIAQYSDPVLRLATIEPVDIGGVVYADEVQARTVWFPPELLPTVDQPDGILFLDELTAADQRL